MKRLVTILPAIMLSLAAFAQGGTKDLWHDKSTRGFELTLKGFVAPWGGWHETLEPSKHFKDFGEGGAMILSYRINKSLSIGISWDYFNAYAMHGFYTYIPILNVLPKAGNIKYNYLEREKFSPYISVTVGCDLLFYATNTNYRTYLHTHYKPNYDRYPGSGYPPYTKRYHISPSAGFDFPITKWCTLFTEVRADWVPDNCFMLSVGAGVTFALHKKKI